MSTLEPTSPPKDSSPTAPPAAPTAALPSLLVSHDVQQVGTKLDALSKRGKLPDFRREGSGFRLSAYGNQMDMTLLGQVTARDGGSEIRFALERQWKLIWVYAAITVLTVWPGMALTDSMLSTYFSGYDFATWKWYVPLVVVPTPIFAWFEIRKSERMAKVSAIELIERIHAVLK
jgi:hypothetical protein